MMDKRNAEYWQVDVAYPSKLVKLLQEKDAFRDASCIFSEAAVHGEYQGSSRSPSNPPEAGPNVETYTFQDRRWAEIFAEKVRKAFGTCSSFELERDGQFGNQQKGRPTEPSILRRAVEEGKDGAVQQEYDVWITEQWIGRIGENWDEGK